MLVRSQSLEYWEKRVPGVVPGSDWQGAWAIERYALITGSGIEYGVTIEAQDHFRRRDPDDARKLPHQ
jgi:hypothetical protein